MESDDGSWEDLQDFGKTDSRLRIVRQPWGNPHNQPTWWVEALNYARTAFVDHTDWLIQLDADEILADNAATAIRMTTESGFPGLFKRYNFWQDTKHLVPDNRCCGEMVARMGPAHLWLPSDEPHPLHEPHLRQTAQFIGGLEIYHFGFLRKPEAFVKKSEVVQNAFFGSCDSRILAYKDKQTDWRTHDYFDGLALRNHIGPMPRPARQWLIDRGYSI